MRDKEETGVDVEIIGFIGLCKNIHKNIINIYFVCRWVGGELTASEESDDVKWIRRNEVSDYVAFPLTNKGLERMLSPNNKVSVFGFTRDPFYVVMEEEFINWLHLRIGKGTRLPY